MTVRIKGVGRANSLYLVLWLLGGFLLLFIVIPLLGLTARQSLGGIVEVIQMPDARASLYITLEAALSASLLAMVFGTPLAYLLSRTAFFGRSLVEAVVDIPLAVPHTVTGIALLTVFGREGWLGKPILQWWGLSFWSTFAGVLIAMLFVSLPYMVNSARIGFDGIDPRLEKVARTLGAGPWQVFAKITLPLVWRSIMTGLTLTFARSISEFGAIVILAYYPETAPIKIYELFLQSGMKESGALAFVVLVIAMLLFTVFRCFLFGSAHRTGEGR